MIFEVIQNPLQSGPSGFSQNQFRKLDQLYCRAASTGILHDRTVECDFDAGLASYTYYRSDVGAPYLQFLIRRTGPRATMYELYKRGKGRIAKSGIFDRTYERLVQEVEFLVNKDSSF
ncbi:MAG: hypothetical protein KDI13_06820 [Alphaproteobacteria bacterium]|nr:hypothetical protein [Alphaproteobacteria bacterium]